MQSERQDQIIQILKDKKHVSIRYLHNNIFASLSTIRRDLIELESNGIIKRYHGNVTLISSNVEPSFNFRKRACSNEKIYICRLAKIYLKNNMSVFIDSSSTTYNMCNHLGDYTNIVAITTGLEAACLLSRLNNVNSFMAGGQISTNATSVTGSNTHEFLKQFSVDIAFVSSLGIDVNGANDADTEQASIRKTMMANAKKTALLVDFSKFDNENYYKLAEFNRLDYIVCEKQPPEKYLEIFKKHGCEVLWK